MPKKCAKFVAEYLIPSLNSQRFGEHLKWIDKKNSIFQLDWCHKGGPKWTEVEAEVFVEWDKIKGHYQPEDKQYYTKSKQRFRALLYKLTIEGQIIKLKSDDKYKKVYCIGEKKQRKRKNNLKNSDARCGFSSADEMSSEDRDGFIEEMSWRRVTCDNLRPNELEDHNYSSSITYSNSSSTHSDCEDQALDHYEDHAVPISLYEWSEDPEKKVLVERNYPYNTNDMLFDGDLQTEMKYVNSAKTGGQTLDNSTYNRTLGYLLKKIDENKIPTENFELDQNANPLSSEILDSSPFNFDLFADSNSEDFTSFLLKII